ncbi:MAG TPA: phosphoribosyltransferase family protein, partial [Streptosporangiaceae bacterium]
VAVAAEVARVLGAPLDVILVRKLGVPVQPELGLGAIGEGGARVINPDVVRFARVSEQEIAAVEERERAELHRRGQRYRGDRPRVPLAGRTAIIVDDGIATGSTARAACQVAKAQGARRVVLAVPVAPRSARTTLAGDADEVICLITPEQFLAIGEWYDDFTQTSDQEVVALLRQAVYYGGAKAREDSAAARKGATAAREDAAAARGGAAAAPEGAAAGQEGAADSGEGAAETGEGSAQPGDGSAAARESSATAREGGGAARASGAGAKRGRPWDAEVSVRAGSAWLPGHLTIPAPGAGIVIFAHGSGSSRHSPRNTYVAGLLNRAGIGTLMFDLLSSDEERDRANVFDISLLASRLAGATGWLRDQPAAAGSRIGYFGASTGAGAALWAASQPESEIAAVVSRGGRPDLAIPRLTSVRAPTLLIVGGLDDVVLGLNRRAQEHLKCECQLAVVPGATHLFEEPGALEQVADLAREWFTRHLMPAHASA